MRKIFIGICFVGGGLSGQMVLRFTNSSVALVIVGIGMIIWGCIQIYNRYAENSGKAGIGTGGDIAPAERVSCPHCGNTAYIITTGKQTCRSCGSDFFYGGGKEALTGQKNVLCPVCNKWIFVSNSDDGDHTCYKCTANRLRNSNRRIFKSHDA